MLLKCGFAVHSSELMCVCVCLSLSLCVCGWGCWASTGQDEKYIVSSKHLVAWDSTMDPQDPDRRTSDSTDPLDQVCGSPRN